jgi:pimeloyl-ACP methyl ester carboxylesterase
MGSARHDVVMKKIVIVMFLLTCITPAFCTDIGSLKFKNCEVGSGFAKTRAECALMEVPEDHGKPGRTIKIHLTLIAATSRNAAPDPAIFLAGGPGQAASDSYGQIANAFRPLLEKRHLLLVDQRGTGLSHSLRCDSPDFDATQARSPEQNLALARVAAKACLAQVGKTAQPQFYTTTDATKDLELLRVALGAPQLNLIGFSYGTRVAQQFAMHFPKSTRSLILDGVAPNSLVLGSEHAKNLDEALEKLFKRCTKDELCVQRFGNPGQTLASLREQYALAAASSDRQVTINDPLTGKPRSIPLNEDALRGVLRFYAYSSDFAALLPLLLDEASKGRPEALVAQSEMAGENLTRMMSYGMQLSVMCAEDAPLLRVNPDDDARLLGSVLTSTLLAQCEVWPKGARPTDFFEPLKSEVPALLISGALDPVTPPRYGDEVVKYLSNSKHIVVPAHGHINIQRGCLPKRVARFLDTLQPRQLKVECVDKIKPSPFFFEMTGPSP